jgi:flagellum-specific peptidoglycan hydrolase FlgJ
MTLLSKGIGQTGGLGALDTLITKLDADKKAVEGQIDTFNSNLYGVKSSMNYVGEKGKSILQTYNDNITSLMDQYAADPSQELKSKISELVVQAKDFANKAVAERQVGVEQLSKIIANPEKYDISVEEARKMFAERYDTPVQASFNAENNEMFIEGPTGPIRLGADGQYNGENPFFVPQRSEMQQISPVGAWGTENKGLFDINSNDFEQDVVSSFAENARYNDQLASTAVYNYLADVKKMDLKNMNETQVSKAVQDITNNPEELTKALDYHGKLEADKLKGMNKQTVDKETQKSFDNLFTGGVNTLEDERQEVFDVADGMTTASGAIAPNAGVFRTNDLKTPISSKQVTALGDDTQIVSFNVGADGRFYVQEEVITLDEDDEEVITLRESVYRSGDDVYESLKNIIPAGVRQKLRDQSAANQSDYEDRVRENRMQRARSNTERKSQQTATTTENQTQQTEEQPIQKTEEQKAADVSAIVADVGLNSPASQQQTQGAFDATTYGGQPAIRSIAETLVEKGYSQEEVANALKSDRFESTMQREGVKPEDSSLRRAFSNIADTAFGLFGYQSKMSKDVDKMAEIAEQVINQEKSDKMFAEEADKRMNEIEEKNKVSNVDLIPITANSSRRDKAENYRIIKEAAVRTGAPFPDVLAAQFAIESGYGKTHSGKNNVFGIKHNPRDAKFFEENGIKTGSENVTTHEVMNGKKVKIKDDFFTFDSIDDAVKAYQLFIENNPRYEKALSAKTSEEYARELKNAGYATKPTYAESIIRVVNDNERIIEGGSDNKSTAR